MISLAEVYYKHLIKDIIARGVSKNPTKGATRSAFAITIPIIPDEVPLLLGRKMYPKGIVGELKAFMANENTVEGFEKHGCNFWGAWSNEDGSLDVDYARLLHDFNGVNQLEAVLHSLKYFPDSRKHVISLWDPSSTAKQVPCVLHYQWYVDNGVLKMIWSQRSVDVMVGLASDMFSAWLLNQIMADALELEAGLVTMQLGDCHIYEEHIDQAIEYVNRVTDGMEKPSFKLKVNSVYDFDFTLKNYRPLSAIKYSLKI